MGILPQYLAAKLQTQNLLISLSAFVSILSLHVFPSSSRFVCVSALVCVSVLFPCCVARWHTISDFQRSLAFALYPGTFLIKYTGYATGVAVLSRH